ncbi:MAG: tetratricopeptide repeat protein [Candidatus Omnitrophica bacterium]|nr:tetratricopeptide repeat protein [Candidatus Omnitrophota bacterium]
MLGKRFFVVIVFIGLLVLFFFGYNAYLVDHSLEDMKFVLEQVSWAQDINDMSRVGVLLDDMLLGEISALDTDSTRVANIEFVKDIASQGFVKKQLTDAEFFLSRLVKEKEEKRSPLLRFADNLNNDLLGLVRFFTKGGPAGTVKRTAFKPSKDTDISLLETAKEYESNWQFEKAIKAYNDFMEKYPAYPQLGLVKLKLGDVYFKSTDYNEAKKMYEEIINQFQGSDEAKMAEVLLKKIKDRIKKQGEEKKVNSEISKLAGSGPMAEDYKELSLSDLQLDKLDNETKELMASISGALKAPNKAVAPGADLIDKARGLEDEWKLKEAQGLYEEFISKYPAGDNVILVKLLLAGAYLKSMQYDRALSAYEKIVEEHPDSEEAKLAKRFSDRTKEMISVYKKRQSLIDKMSKITSAQDLAHNYYRLGVLNIYLFDVKRAEKAFKNVMELAPGTDLAKKAQFKTFSEIISQSPRDKIAADAKYQLANAYYKWGKYAEAAKNYQELNRDFAGSNLAPLAQFQAGYTLLYNLHSPLEAAAAFGELKKKYAGSSLDNYVNSEVVPVAERSYRYYGFLLLKEGKLEEAENAFIKAIAADSNDAWSHCGLGTAYALLKNYDEGIKLAQEGVSLSSDAYTHAALGFVYQEKGDYQKAIEEYKRSIEYEPSYFAAYYNLGRVYILTEQYELAIKELKGAVKAQPNIAYAHNDLGYVYASNGQIVSAENEFKEALLNDPHMTEASYNLGILYETSGRYQRAAHYFRQVLSDMPDFEPAKQQLEYVETKIK